jgi:hypothetical protein
MALSKRNPANIRFVTLHHSGANKYAGAPNNAALKVKAAQYNGDHKKKEWAERTKTDGKFGYPYISYHYMIGRDGSVLQVQDDLWLRYHAGDSDHNMYGIAICIDGNYDQFKMTDAQVNAAANLIKMLNKRYGRKLVVRTHGEVSDTKTSCAGMNIGKTSDPNSVASRIIRISDSASPAPQPPVTPSAPNADLVTRRDVVADAVQIVRGKLLSVNGSARKDEWQRILNYLDKRGKELG